MVKKKKFGSTKSVAKITKVKATEKDKAYSVTLQVNDTVLSAKGDTVLEALRGLVFPESSATPSVFKIKGKSEINVFLPIGRARLFYSNDSSQELYADTWQRQVDE